ASWSLTPGSDSVERAESTAQGRTAAIASATFADPSPPASITRPEVARARSRCDASDSPHGRSTTVATRSPRRSSTASRARWPFSRPYSCTRSASVSSASPTKTATRRTVSGAGVNGRVDVLRACQAAHLHERTPDEPPQLFAGFAGAHQGRAYEDGVRAGELGGRRLRARLDSALRDDDPVAG